MGAFTENGIPVDERGRDRRRRHERRVDAGARRRLAGARSDGARSSRTPTASAPRSPPPSGWDSCPTSASPARCRRRPRSSCPTGRAATSAASSTRSSSTPTTGWSRGSTGGRCPGERHGGGHLAVVLHRRRSTSSHGWRARAWPSCGPRRPTTSRRCAPVLANAVAWIAGTGPVTAAHLEAAPALRVVARYGTGVDAVDLPAAAARRRRRDQHARGQQRGRGRARHRTAVRAAPRRAGGRPPRAARRLERLARPPAGRLGRRRGRPRPHRPRHDAAADRAGVRGAGARPVRRRPGRARHRRQARDARAAAEHGSGRVAARARRFHRRRRRRGCPAARPTRCVVNTARADLVDEAAVARALREGRLAGFAADTLATEAGAGLRVTAARRRPRRPRARHAAPRRADPRGRRHHGHASPSTTSSPFSPAVRRPIPWSRPGGRA